jgi:hypothetical protein
MTNDTQNLLDLKNALADCKPLFEQLRGHDFKTANFDEIEEPVKQIYDALSKVKGVNTLAHQMSCTC